MTPKQNFRNENWKQNSEKTMEQLIRADGRLVICQIWADFAGFDEISRMFNFSMQGGS